MESARPHPDPTPRPAGRGSPRLNLLLSYAGWQPDPWVDRLPRLLEPMGIFSLRAGSGSQASQVIRTNRIHVALVDLGLPLEEVQSDSDPEFQEGGSRLLEILHRLDEPPPVVAIKRARTHRDEAREIAQVLRLGAFAVLDRPHDVAGLDLVLEVLRRCLERHYSGRWPHAGPGVGAMPLS